MRACDGFLSQVPLDVQFGLGSADRVDEVSVRWPSGATETWRDLPADRLVTLTEGSAEAESSAIPRWPDGSAPRAKPSFSYQRLADRAEGGNAPLAAPGTPVVINFWAPWCEPCKTELPALARLARSSGNAVQFVGVSVDRKDPASVLAAARQFGVDYPQFLADDDLLSGFFGGGGEAPIPATYVFDGAGRLRRAFHRAVGEAELAAILSAFRDEDEFTFNLHRRAGIAALDRRWKDAADLFRAASERDPGKAELFTGLGDACVELKRFAEAADAFRSAARLNPESSHAHANLGVALLRLKLPGEALSSLRRAVELRGEDHDLLMNLGAAAGEAGELDAALDAFDRGLKLSPRSTTAWLGKGKVLMIKGQLREASECFREVLTIDPANADAKANLARLKPR